MESDVRIPSTGRARNAWLQFSRGALLAALAIAGATHAAAAEEQTDDQAARAVVERLQSTLLDIMKNGDQLGFSGRISKIKPVMNETYDFNYIVRSILGPSAGQLSADELKQATAAFADVSAKTYASEFKSYGGEQFVILKEEAGPRGMQIVRTRMQSPGGTNVRFDYLLRPVEGRWLIVNTIAEGVSQLALDRSQAQSALKERGFDGLMAWIRGRAPQQ